MEIKRNFSICLAFVSLSLSLVSTPVAAQVQVWEVAIEQDRPSQLVRELAKGLDPNSRDQALNPALMLAIRHGSWRAYDTLLENRHTDVELANGRQETPMMYLALLGDTKRLQQLQQRGGQINRLGWTPLHYAASKGRADTVRYLLSQQAQVNAPAPDGTSPLMMAALSGNKAVVDLLLKAGADPVMNNAQHLVAADWARSAGHDKLADYLEQVSASHALGVDPFQAAQPMTEPARAPSAAAAPNTSQTEPTGTSRYFDLNRFDEPVTP